MQIDGTLESQLILLRKVVRRLSTRDLCEEFCLIRISPLAREWGLSINEDEEVLGLPASPSLLASNVSFFILPALSFCVCGHVSTHFGFFYTLSVHRDLRRRGGRRRWLGPTIAELACLCRDGRVNRVHAGELPSRSIPSKVGDDDVGMSRKRERAVAKDG